MAYLILHDLNLFTSQSHLFSLLTMCCMLWARFKFLLVLWKCHTLSCFCAILAAIPHMWNTFSLKFIWIISSFLSFHYSQEVFLYTLRLNLTLLCSTSVLNNTSAVAVIALFCNAFYALPPGYKWRKGRNAIDVIHHYINRRYHMPILTIVI